MSVQKRTQKKVFDVSESTKLTQSVPIAAAYNSDLPVFVWYLVPLRVCY